MLLLQDACAISTVVASGLIFSVSLALSGTALCQTLVYTSLTGTLIIQVLIAAILIEKVRDTTTPPVCRPRVRDKEYLCHAGLILFINFPVAAWMFYRCAPTLTHNRCFISVPLDGVLPIFLCLSLSTIYLTLRFCIPLVRSGHREMQTWAVQTACGAFLANAVLTGGVVTFVVNARRLAYLVNLIAIFEILVTGFAMHVLIMPQAECKRIQRIDAIVPDGNWLLEDGLTIPSFQSQVSSYRPQVPTDTGSVSKRMATQKFRQFEHNVAEPYVSRRIATDVEIAQYLSQFHKSADRDDRAKQGPDRPAAHPFLRSVLVPGPGRSSVVESSSLSIHQINTEIELMGESDNMTAKPREDPSIEPSSAIMTTLNDFYRRASGPSAINVPDCYESAESARADLFACDDSIFRQNSAIDHGENLVDQVLESHSRAHDGQGMSRTE